MTRSTGVPASARVKLLVKRWNITTSLNPSGGALEGIEGASWGVVVQLRVLLYSSLLLICVSRRWIVDGVSRAPHQIGFESILIL